jgi:hypothetical protein
MTSLVPCQPMSSLKVSRGSIVLGLMMAGSSVDSRVVGLIVGSSVANLLIASSLVASPSVAGSLAVSFCFLALFTPYILS